MRKVAAASAVTGAGLLGAESILGVPKSVNATTAYGVIPPDYTVYNDGSGNINIRNGLSGNIDYSSTDAASAFQTAINDLPSAGGCVTIRQGTYTLTSTVNLNKANVTLAGVGMSTILTQPSGLNLPNLIHVSANTCTIRDMSFDGNGGGIIGAGQLHYDLGSDYSRGHNLHFKNAYDNGIFINSAVGGPAQQPSKPQYLWFSGITGTGNGLAKGGSTFDNGSGSRVTLTNYVTNGDGTGLVLTDIGGGADTYASALAVNGAKQDGIYNGSVGVLSNFISQFNGRYGLFLDGTLWASVSHFDMNNNSVADLDVQSSGTPPQNPFQVSFGRLRSSTPYTSSVNNRSVVNIFQVFGYPYF